jgi:hypothetical protein
VSLLIESVAGQPDIELTVAGDGPLAGIHRQQAANAGADNVRFAGRVSDDELAQLYHRHDVIVLPSTTRAEAFGLVLLEGMIAGCVPVASDLPGVRDVAGPTGLLVAPGDAAGLRRALLSLAANRGRLEALSEASRRTAMAQPWDGVSRAYTVAFEDAIHDRDAARWSDALRQSIRPPERQLPALADHFKANWWSLVLFDKNGAGPMARWGRGAAQEFRREQPDVAAYVARSGEPLVIDRDRSPAELRPMLNRPDITSAMAVPVEMKRMRGVLSLTAAGRHRPAYTDRDLDALVQLVAR